MRTSYGAVFATLLLVACNATPTSTTTSSSASSQATSAPALSVASAVPTAAATASTASSSAAASPCPEGARKNDDARYCITLPAKKLAVSYEGDSPSQGIREELEIAGDRVVITVGPARAGQTVASLKEAALKRIGAALVESGDLTNGYWTDLKGKGGEHIIEGVVVSTYVITCTYWVADDKNVEAARMVCRSLRTF